MTVTSMTILYGSKQVFSLYVMTSQRKSSLSKVLSVVFQKLLSASRYEVPNGTSGKTQIGDFSGVDLDTKTGTATKETMLTLS